MPENLQRRVAGYHDIRMDGMTDLVCRAPGASVLDLGCNRGLVGFEFANNGAKLVHGCDNFEQGIRTAKHLFSDLRAVESKFEVVDLAGGSEALKAAFGDQHYDIILMLATMHKLQRVMSGEALTELLRDLGNRCQKFFAWRGTSTDLVENEQEMKRLDVDLAPAHLRRVHTSYISDDLGVAAVWRRS